MVRHRATRRVLVILVLTVILCRDGRLHEGEHCPLSAAEERFELTCDCRKSRRYDSYYHPRPHPTKTLLRRPPIHSYPIRQAPAPGDFVGKCATHKRAGYRSDTVHAADHALPKVSKNTTRSGRHVVMPQEEGSMNAASETSNPPSRGDSRRYCCSQLDMLVTNLRTM